MSGKIDDGGSAFPHEALADYRDTEATKFPGMSYRQWLIGKAMQGMCANSDYAGMKYEVLAGMARKQADAVIAELKGGEK